MNSFHFKNQSNLLFNFQLINVNRIFLGFGFIHSNIFQTKVGQIFTIIHRLKKYRNVYSFKKKKLSTFLFILQHTHTHTKKTYGWNFFLNIKFKKFDSLVFLNTNIIICTHTQRREKKS